MFPLIVSPTSTGSAKAQKTLVGRPTWFEDGSWHFICSFQCCSLLRQHDVFETAARK